ncbi:hypothetical protein CR164_11725 [Prosthecochloris marina]|uniref:Uncharacterized protein n=1 Tax=Prosthecochloris marina TaxID=2017681 RepID=A0A317T3D1_9CHLB|nr:hypothetical protein CR164_11725 [Prosthecochloris marina]
MLSVFERFVKPRSGEAKRTRHSSISKKLSVTDQKRFSQKIVAELKALQERRNMVEKEHQIFSIVCPVSFAVNS